jgi:hypothetical protein
MRIDWKKVGNVVGKAGIIAGAVVAGSRPGLGGAIAGVSQTVEASTRPNANTVPIVHGKTCPKAPHEPFVTGYLHAADDDTSFDVDGALYCGRCHVFLG